MRDMSHPAWGAWIEMRHMLALLCYSTVELLTECVD